MVLDLPRWYLQALTARHELVQLLCSTRAQRATAFVNARFERPLQRVLLPSREGQMEGPDPGFGPHFPSNITNITVRRKKHAFRLTLQIEFYGIPRINSARARARDYTTSALEQQGRLHTRHQLSGT